MVLLTSWALLHMYLCAAAVISVGAVQVFPTSYEFRDRLLNDVFAEPDATCPDVIMRTKKYKVCYYNSEIRPKLIDCDLGEGTYNDSAYLLRKNPNRRPGQLKSNFEFRFTFDPPLVLSSFILYYYCSHGNVSAPVELSYVPINDTGHGDNDTQSVVCNNTLQREVLFNQNIPGKEYQNVTITIIMQIPEMQIFLSEVQFFNETDDGYCKGQTCCRNGTICHVSSTEGYECECPDVLYGSNCQFTAPCALQPCQNGGTCNDHQGDYSCTCPSGYSGRNCEMDGGVSQPTSRPPDQNHSSSSSSSPSATAAPVGAVVSVFVVILIISGFVAVLVYCRRKKGKKSRKIIEHIGEDESNVYALVAKPRKKRNAPPTVPLQNFDPVEEGLDKMETPPLAHSDPSTGQASTSPLVYADNKCFDCVDSIDPEEQSPPSRPLTGPNTYDTVDVNKRTPEDPYYSVPDTNGHGPPPAYGADSSNVYEDTASAANTNAVLQNSVPVGNDDFEVDTNTYAIVN